MSSGLHSHNFKWSNLQISQCAYLINDFGSWLRKFLFFITELKEQLYEDKTECKEAWEKDAADLKANVNNAMSGAWRERKERAW